MTDDRLRRQYRFTVTPEHLIRDRRISDRAVRLWMLLDRYAGDNGAAFPKRETLADDLTCSMSTVDRAVTELVDAQWLAKERRSAGDVNVYTLMIAPPSNEPATKRKKQQVKPKGVVTSDERGGVVTHDETPSSPVTTGVVTHDAYKEASLNENQGRIFPAADASAPGKVVDLFGNEDQTRERHIGSQAVDVWVRAYEEGTGSKPLPKHCKAVGSAAKRLVMKEGVSVEEILTAARNCGAAGWVSLDQQLLRDRRSRLHPLPSAAAGGRSNGKPAPGRKVDPRQSWMYDV